jgi:hypothetical protein
MNTNDSRGRAEIADLARLMPVPSGRDLPAGRRQILKEHLMSELRRADATSQPPVPAQLRRRPRSLAAVAGAGALAVAVGVALGANALHTHTTTAVPSSGRAGSSTTSAAVLLAKIASAAASQPTPAVGNSEFMYIRSDVADTSDTIANGHETQAMDKLHERQIWLPVANICATGLLIEDGSSTPISPFAAPQGKTGGSPQVQTPRPDVTCPSEGNLGDPTYRLLQSLPTSPAALLRKIEAGNSAADDDAIGTIGSLIQETIAPPAVAAALYRAAALLPGATLISDAVNADGEHGIGIAWTSSNGNRNEWIFSRSTLQYIGDRVYNVSTGVVSGESAILQRAFVDKAGQLPANG